MPGGCAWHRSRSLALRTRQLHRHQPSKQEHSWLFHCIAAEYQCFGLDILKPIKKGDASLLKATAVSPSRYMPSYTEKRFGNRIGNRNNCSSVSRSSIARREPIHLCGTTQILATTILIFATSAQPHNAAAKKHSQDFLPWTQSCEAWDEVNLQANWNEYIISTLP